MAYKDKPLAYKDLKKLGEIKAELCRFCFAANSEKTVLLSSLEDYGVSINEILQVTGLNTQYNHLFSNFMCEECFQELVGFDGYRKKCQKAEQDIMVEIRDLKGKLDNSHYENSQIESSSSLDQLQQIVKNEPNSDYDFSVDYEENLSMDSFVMNITTRSKGAGSSQQTLPET